MAISRHFGALWRQFFAQNRQKKYFYKSFDVDILAFEKRPNYCGDKFGDFSPKAGDFSPKAGDFFSTTPGHTAFNQPKQNLTTWFIIMQIFRFSISFWTKSIKTT